MNSSKPLWGGGISPTCLCCGNEDETVLHVLRDCIHATQWKNKNIFEVGFIRPNNPISLIGRFVQDIEDCNLEHFHIGPKLKEIIYIGWKRSHEGWIKLNSDGACKNMGIIFGCGGLFRDLDGRWVKCYTKKIRACDALHAEMWGYIWVWTWLGGNMTLIL
ncbi:uncharacterized protein [Medicago truncatula]|uniref:uncharacterized protein n=1 Tax=Medicago truncatula TaxID=3880 RepID=UPI000D2F1C57|nr:uncharacterized protein LOC112416682 [Medicago truncatula]